MKQIRKKSANRNSRQTVITRQIISTPSSSSSSSFSFTCVFLLIFHTSPSSFYLFSSSCVSSILFFLPLFVLFSPPAIICSFLFFLFSFDISFYTIHLLPPELQSTTQVQTWSANSSKRLCPINYSHAVLDSLH